jgi:hormone-sensitive lipase
LKLDVPILSIDYSLAPKAAFPRAVEEIFYAYSWALKNSELFGSTGENIVLVGDSAGGNLVTACVIKCIEMGIPRPKGLLNIYAVFMANHVTSPSRYLSLMDVVLTHSMYTRLFPAYNGYEKEALVIENRKIPKLSTDGNNKLPTHHLFSPHFAPDKILRDFPPTIVVSTTLDACLDEGVEFAKRLKKVNVEVQLDVLEGLNHGFLNVSQVSDDLKKLNDLLL